MQDLKTEEKYVFTVTKYSKIIVDVYTSFCVPCKVLAPQLEKLSEDYKDVHFFKINAENNEFLMNGEQGLKKEITSVPTILSIYEGKEIERVEGANFGAVKKMVERLERL